MGPLRQCAYKPDMRETRLGARQAPPAPGSESLGFTYSLHCSSLFLGLTNFVLRILKGNPKKELEWRL